MNYSPPVEIKRIVFLDPAREKTREIVGLQITPLAPYSSRREFQEAMVDFYDGYQMRLTTRGIIVWKKINGGIIKKITLEFFSKTIEIKIL